MIYRRFRRRHKQAVHTCTVLVSLSSVPLVSRDLQRIAARIAERHVLRACLYRGYSIHLRLSCRSHGGTLTRPFCRAACRANAQREQGKRERYVTGISDYLLYSLRRTAFVRLFTIQVSRIPLSRYGGMLLNVREVLCGEMRLSVYVIGTPCAVNGWTCAVSLARLSRVRRGRSARSVGSLSLGMVIDYHTFARLSISFSRKCAENFRRYFCNNLCAVRRACVGLSRRDVSRRSPPCVVSSFAQT